MNEVNDDTKVLLKYTGKGQSFKHTGVWGQVMPVLVDVFLHVEPVLIIKNGLHDTGFGFHKTPEGGVVQIRLESDNA